MMQHQLIDNMCNILSPQKEADSKKKQPQKTEKIKIQTMDTHEKKKSPPPHIFQLIDRHHAPRYNISVLVLS